MHPGNVSAQMADHYQPDAHVRKAGTGGTILSRPESLHTLRPNKSDEIANQADTRSLLYGSQFTWKVTSPPGQ